MGFDIRALSDATFPEALCPRCGAIVHFRLVWHHHRHRTETCTVCGQRWILKPGEDWNAFFRQYDTLCDVESQWQHARDLFNATRTPRELTAAFTLFQLMAATQRFFHFATWNISDAFLGAAAILSTRVHVRGVVGKMDARQREALEVLESGSVNLSISVHGDASSWDSPHQKLYVFDGLVAIDGSANFTTQAWKKVDAKTERIRFVTDIDEVRDINNRFFSPHWRSILWSVDEM